jgi:hypothetical protein
MGKVDVFIVQLTETNAPVVLFTVVLVKLLVWQVWT